MALETDLSPSSSPQVKSGGLHGRERVSPPNISPEPLYSVVHSGFSYPSTLPRVFGVSHLQSIQGNMTILSLCGWELSHFPPTNISTHFEDPLTSWLLPRKFFILPFSPSVDTTLLSFLFSSFKSLPSGCQDFSE